MKTLLLFAIIALSIFTTHSTSSAQKIKKSTISFEYTSFPELGVADNYKTYILKTRGSFHKLNFILDKVKELSPGKLNRVDDDTKADLIIQFSGGQLSIIEEKIIKESSGMIKKEVTFRCPITVYMFENGNDRYIHKNELTSQTDTLKYVSTAYANESQMNLLLKKDDVSKGMYYLIINLIESYYNKFNLEDKKLKFTLYTVKDKTERFEAANEVVELMENDIFDEPVDQLLSTDKTEILKSNLDHFISITNQEGLDASIINGMHANLAFSYLWINDFNEAWKHAELAGESSKDLIDFISEFQHRYAHNVRSANLYDQIQGTWITTGISGIPYDFNEDGSRNSDYLNKELSPCYKKFKITFGSGNVGILYEYSGDDCSENLSEIYYKLKLSPHFSEIILGWGEIYDNEKTIDEYWLVEHFSHGNLVLKGQASLDSNSDTSQELLLSLKKVD